ncbi:transcription factor bHLH146 [Cocos nucifera]|uniref:Transcription factor bHLH146 n=1 Tax=Cocos nucifera TaxID=13894 RepID=A0A8K0HUN8_COCNU|nr:transcription factor bHLH146 [Cocos nucifera]
MQRSKRRRIYSLEPNATIYTGFPHKYVSHLLPALTKAISCGGKNDADIENMVSFEVDMALALSATGFKWSRALKRELEQRMNSNQLHQPPTGRSSIVRMSKHQMLDHLLPPLPVPRPLVDLTHKSRPKRTWKRRSYGTKTRGEKEFSYRMRILRGILPGGNEMDLCELLSQVESYVVCLQLQVTILRSLVETP